MFSIYSNYHTLCYTFMWFFKTRQGLTNSFVFRDDLTMMSILTKKRVKNKRLKQHLRLKKKNMLGFKKSLPKCSLQGSRTNWCWMMEWKSTKCSQRELSQNIHAAVSVPAAISLEWLCSTMYGIIWPYLTLQPSVHWQCMEYFKYYLCTKCTYSWSITTCWEFWIVSWEEGEEEKLFYQRSIGHWSSPLLLSVWEMGVAFSTIFFWSCISNPTQGLILYHI